MKSLVLSLLLAFFATGAAAQHSHPAAATPAASAAAGDFAEGEVKRLDKAAARVTIRHGEIRSIGMGPMTMTFPVKPAALLDRVAAGDKVRFKVEVVSGDPTVTAIAKAK